MVLLPMLFVALFAVTAAKPTAEDSCAVEITIPYLEARHMSDVHPSLVSQTLEVIYFPDSGRGRIRVHALPPETEPGTKRKTTIQEVLLRRIPTDGFHAYHLAESHATSINYADVEQQATDGHYLLPAGVYRYSLNFSSSGLAAHKGGYVHLCTVYSPVFKVREDQEILHLH